jgi:regulator of sigma E protease
VLITIVAFLAVIAVVILAHEIGHFATAKAFGVRVDEFGVGYPPRLIGVKRGKTTYSLNALPFGGFVKMAGEEDPKVKDSLASKSIAKRLIVMSSGSIMNALLPLLLFSLAFMIPHDVVVGTVVVEDVAPGSPAEAVGFQPQDVILTAGGKEVKSNYDISRYIQLNLGQEITFMVRHSDQTIEEISVVPRWQPPEDQGAIGVLLHTIDASIIQEQQSFWEAIPSGVNQCTETYILFKNAILGIFIGTTSFEPLGPVGIAQVSGEFAKAGIGPLLEFTAFFSINLAILNLLPLPALDGGRIAFVLVEWVRRGRRISPEKEGRVHMVGFMLLIALLIAITLQDIVRIIGGGSPLP